MDSSSLIARQALMREIEDALGRGASGVDLVELIIRSGWQPRPVPDPGSDYFEGVLADGRHVPIEIRHGRLNRTS